METSNGETGNGIPSCVHSSHGKRERNAVQKEMRGACQKAGEGLCKRACSDRRRGNGAKLKEGRSRLGSISRDLDLGWLDQC